MVESIHRNYILLAAFIEGLFWYSFPLMRYGLILVSISLILRTTVFCIEYLVLKSRPYFKNSDLEILAKDDAFLSTLLTRITFIGWIGYFLMLNGLFSGLFSLWLLLSEQSSLEILPKLTIPPQNMTFFSSEHSRQSVFHRGAFLGFFTGAGVVLALISSANGLGIYLIFLSTFHLLEYLCIAINTTQVTLSAFLLNHSKEYNIAIIGSLLEYLIEWYLFPTLKSWNSMISIAIIFCILGQVIRSVAMITAKTNFTHLIRTSKVEGHELVKTGIYKYFCHPSYTGFFYWAVSLQIILMNPICFLGYIKILSHFFSDRILAEEASLIGFFGQDYIDYRKTTYLLIPEI